VNIGYRSQKRPFGRLGPPFWLVTEVCPAPLARPIDPEASCSCSESFIAKRIEEFSQKELHVIFG